MYYKGLGTRRPIKKI